MELSIGRTLGRVVAGLLCGLTSAAALADGPARTSAADPYAYAPPPEQLFYNWSGFYIGAHMGGSSTKWASALDPGTTVLEQIRASNSNFFGGGQLGYQHQFRSMVLGGEVSYSTLGGGLSTASVTQAGLNLSSEVKDLLLVTGKVGYAYMTYLFYFKGGYASADVNTSTSGTFASSGGNRASGWVGGLGVNYALHRNIIVGAEYNYIRLNNDNVALTDGVNTANFSGSHWDVQNVMLRLDFKFGGGPH